MGYQLASVLAGGLSPLIATALLGYYGWSAVALYTAIMALITVVATYLAAETYQGNIFEDQPEERRLITES